MSAYTVVVEVQFDGVTWTDVSAYVRLAEGIRITRGRGDEQGDVQPGVMSLTLINDGRFTPGTPTSPYYPNVRKGRRIRCSVVVGVTAYTRFDGYVNEWPVQWEGGDALSLTSITCTDLFKRLGGLAPMRSLLEEEMLYLAPDAYYTLGEESGATSAGDTSGKAQPSMGVYQVAGAAGTVTFGEEDGPGTDALTAAQFTPFSSTQGKGLRANLASPAGGSCVIACWLSTAAAGRDFLHISTRSSGLSGAAVAVGVDTDGTLRVTALNGDEFLVGDFGTIIPSTLADEKNHLVAVHIKSDGGVFVSIDGVTAGTGLGYGTYVRTDVYDRLAAGGFRDSVSGVATLHAGVISHVWFKRTALMPDWSYVWSAGTVAAEVTVDRFYRIAGLLGITPALKGDSATVMDAQVAGGKAPLQAFRDVAAVEAGLVYAARDSADLVLECRSWRYNKASSITLTIDDIGGDLTWSDDDQPLANDVTNRRDGGADQRVTDAASIAAYGHYTGGSSQPWASDYDALANAQWLVGVGADPPPRITQVTVKASTISQHTGVLGLDLSDVITLTSLPATSPQASVALHIEGYTESIDAGMHTIAFNTSPAEPNQVWELGVSDLGITTRLAL